MREKEKSPLIFITSLIPTTAKIPPILLQTYKEVERLAMKKELCTPTLLQKSLSRF